jgi:hypothetical protein
MTTPQTGEFRNVSLAQGEHHYLVGALDSASIADGATLSVEGAIAGIIGVGGVLVATGALVGTIRVLPTGVAVLQGFINATVHNEGVVVVDAQPQGATPSITNVGSGRSGGLDLIPSHLRAKLPTITTDS